MYRPFYYRAWCLPHVQYNTTSERHVKGDEEQGWWRHDSVEDKTNGMSRKLQSVLVNWLPMCVRAGTAEGWNRLCSWARTITILDLFDSKGLCLLNNVVHTLFFHTLGVFLRVLYWLENVIFVRIVLYRVYKNLGCLFSWRSSALCLCLRSGTFIGCKHNFFPACLLIYMSHHDIICTEISNCCLL